jgi:hypothetical protein
MSVRLSALWTPFQTHYFSENLVVQGIEPGPLDLLPGTMTTRLERPHLHSISVPDKVHIFIFASLCIPPFVIFPLSLHVPSFLLSAVTLRCCLLPAPNPHKNCLSYLILLLSPENGGTVILTFMGFPQSFQGSFGLLPSTRFPSQYSLNHSTVCHYTFWSPDTS